MEKKRVTVILIGDGMGDYPLAELHGLTPLEAARTPAMDYIAAHGRLLRLQTIPPGFPPGSDVANLSLLGYDPAKYYTGRAPLEAASMGVKLGPHEIAFRCNLVTLEHQAGGGVMMADYSGGHISTAEAAPLILELDARLGNEKIRFYPGVSYRHLLVMPEEIVGLETVPPHDYTGQDVSRFWQRYQQSELAAVMVQAGEILSSHEINVQRRAAGHNPANGIWLWGEGRSPAMPTIQQQYNLSGSLISAVDLLKGIGVYAGMEIINVPGATGYLDTNYQGKADSALAAILEKDLVVVHIEAPDEVSHQGLMQKKILAIEDFDQKIVQPILDALLQRSDFSLAVAMDHYTPVSTRTHASLPAPFAVLDSRQQHPSSGQTFSEKNAQTGELLSNGEEFFKLLLSGKE